MPVYFLQLLFCSTMVTTIVDAPALAECETIDYMEDSH